MKKRILVLVLALLVVATVFTGCGGDSKKDQKESKSNETEAVEEEEGEGEVEGELTAAGSSALLPLAQKGAEDFMDKNPECVVTVNGGGSGEGIKQVADGAVDIGNSDVYAEEKIDASAASDLVDHKVCLITMAPVVNKDLGVDDLTTDQLVSIFTGKTTNWKDVGGPDEEILLVTRPSSSGTRAIFKEWALDGAEEASNQALETDDSGTLLETVKQNKGAIGYVALSYLVDEKDVVAVSIDGVEPSLENTYNGTYKVWGWEHMYTKGEGSEQAQAFIEFMMSDEFGKEIEKNGYGVSSKVDEGAAKEHSK